jgi:hypothetical protein
MRTEDFVASILKHNSDGTRKDPDSDPGSP